MKIEIPKHRAALYMDEISVYHEYETPAVKYNMEAHWRNWS